jgi:F-type H+-transporting ATPase subunit delta
VKVAEGSSPVSGVAERYATALFDLARESNSLDRTQQDLDTFARLVASSPDLARLVRSPVFSTEEQGRAVSVILTRAGITGIVSNFIRLAARNRRLFAVPEMVTAFRRILARHRGELTAEVTSAEPLSDRQVAALKQALAEKLGKDVALERKINPALIGGFVVKIGSRMIDTSLRTKLNSLKLAMKEVR